MKICHYLQYTGGRFGKRRYAAIIHCLWSRTAIYPARATPRSGGF